MPYISVSRFKRTSTNTLVDSFCHLYLGGEGHHQIIDVLTAHIEDLRHNAKAPRFINFCSNIHGVRTHNKESIDASTALVVEYPLSKKQEVIAAAANLGYDHFIIDSEQKTTNHITVVWPFSKSIQDVTSKQRNLFTRIAACMMTQMGITGVSRGCDAATFLFSPTPTAQIIWHRGSGLLDPEAYKRATAKLSADTSWWVGAGMARPQFAVIEEEKPADADGLIIWAESKIRA